ncbi:MAG: DUF5696 domain-containing protein [Ruminococcus sp.]|nr:DUF5696 domain-containing protein [Ruminococcus sp.]
MGNKIKKFLLCLLAVSMLTTAGTIYAADEDEQSSSADTVSDEEDETSEEEEKSKRQEEVEDVELTAEQAEKLLHKIGTIDGLDIYYKSEDYDDEIWAAHGGNPKDSDDYDKDAEPTQEQTEAEEEIDLLKPIGDFVAVDPEAGAAVASFDDYSKCDEGRIYVSDAGRYVLTVDEELTEAIKIREVISAIDDPYLFKSEDGETLELMDEDYEEVLRTYTYDREEDDMLVYVGDDDEEQFAWISTDMTQVYGTFRYAAENESYRMLVDDRTAIIGLENNETGYIWWSSPLGSTRDEIATPLLINELRSSSVLRYGIPERRASNNWLRSNTEDCTVTVTDISGGIRVVYDYEKVGIKYPVEYTIEDDHMKASLKVEEIEETNSANVTTEITLLGSFGAASTEEDGYFVIPDGSGALVRFNNGKTEKNSYSQKVYGSDVTAVPTTKAAVTEQVYLPVYGIVKEDNAMLVVASKGDSNATLNASVSKQSNSSYNLCNFTFVLRNTDTFYMSGSSTEELTVFESGSIKSDDIELLYYPISKEDASYVDVAARYRQYLMEEEGVTDKTEADSSPMYVDLYGGTEKETPILGIPITMKTSFTSYSEAQEILTLLNNSGVDDIVVSYNNWTNDGIKNQVDTDAKPSGTLGGKSDFSDLTDYIESKGFEFYPSSDNRDFYSGNGYYSFTSTCVRVSGSYSRIVSYDRAYGIPDGFKKNMSLLSPSLFTEVFGEVSSNYSSNGLDGISLGSLTTSLYGDYGKKGISRYDAMNLLTESYADIDSKLENDILADSANAYVLPYVSHVTGVPLCSSGFDMFDENIPFYQLVLHGLIPYSTEAINGSADSETLLLMAVATGSNLSYDMLYEKTSTLKDTEFDVYYYANYANWIDTASAEYKLVSSILSDVSDCTIDDYQVSDDGSLVTATYSNGTVIKVDFTNKTIDENGTEYDLTEYAEEGGIKF